MDTVVGQEGGREVTVIGASTAGLFTAYLLARQGVQVRVFEGAKDLEPMCRTLIVTHRLRDLLGSLGKSAIVNEIGAFELFADGQTATVHLHTPDLIVERATLIRQLAEHATAAGVQILFGLWFRGLTTDGQQLRLTVECGRGGTQEEIQTSTVIGADGAFSKVSQAAGWPQQPVVPLVQALVRLPAGLASHTTRVWFVPEDTPYFYWLIPESPTHGVLGLIGEEGQKTRQCLERFLEQQGLQPIAFQGARIPLYTRWIPVHRQMGGGHVYLVGDAAGQVKVSTVGGLVTGFRGAMGVAEAILGDKSQQGLHTLRREMNVHLLVRRTLHRFTLGDYTHLLRLLHPTTRHSLSVYSRDEAGKLLLRLCLRQPRLLLMGLRALLLGGSLQRPPRS